MATILEMTAQIVSAHAGSTSLSSDEILAELKKVHAALTALETGVSLEKPAEEEQKPALTIRQAFKKEEVVCMICGKGGMKTLTRHLSTVHEMKPREYRKQFGIPSKQPLAAKSFSEERRKMAQERGLGDVLAKAREARMANLQKKKSAPAKKAAKAK
ncbi:MucR family transcriptional regulator [Geobacter anodireducens]